MKNVLMVPRWAAVAGLLLNPSLILRARHAGESIFAHPHHLILTAGVLIVIQWETGAILTGPHPRWIGVPNCD